ncbi:MAG TPA: SDR family oxidoreductase [Mucilaginibacter sp.]|nr:SDR family oxidoreductase [Mucilaginibacter sp.]
MDKQLQFKDLWAIILGGSGGFGYAAVQKLARHGMNIALIYRENKSSDQALKHDLDSLASENHIRILPYNINALDDDAREGFIADFSTHISKGSVKLLLHSIARGNLKPLAIKDNPGEDQYNTLSVEDIKLTTYAMATSLLDWTRSILRSNLFNADARIIGLTSEGAHKFWESYAAVSIAKASLESLAKYMAVEFSPYGLKTNVIQAGVTETASLKRIPGSDKLLEMSAKRNPMGRMTKPEDVAAVIYLLCSDEAFFINGSIIHADGGEHLR